MSPQQRRQRGRWLISAIVNGRTARALDLIGQGADLTASAPEDGPVLYAAIAYQGYPLVEPLLAAGADPNVPGPSGAYPVHLVAKWAGDEAPRLMELLLRCGARIDVRDAEGATPAFLAGKHASEEVIRMLLTHGGDISERNDELDTALTFACCWGRTDRARMLLDLGIDIHARDDGGMNALHWASREGHVAAIELLLERGALPNETTLGGATALVYAARHGSVRSVELLLAAGADPAIRDGNGRTALDYAREYAHQDLARALVDKFSELPSASLPASIPIAIRRFLNPSGEPAIEISAVENGSGWSVEKCDGFAAIVELLETASR